MADFTLPNEKRRHQRIKKHFTARVRTYSDHSSPDWNIVVLRDLSAGGAMLVHDHRLPLGSLVNLKINFSGERPIQCFGHVLRSQQISSSFHEVAVGFNQIDVNDARLIDGSVVSHYARKTADSVSA